MGQLEVNLAIVVAVVVKVAAVVMVVVMVAMEPEVAAPRIEEPSITKGIAVVETTIAKAVVKPTIAKPAAKLAEPTVAKPVAKTTAWEPIVVKPKGIALETFVKPEATATTCVHC